MEISSPISHYSSGLCHGYYLVDSDKGFISKNY